MLAQGHTQLSQDVAAKVETAPGDSFPYMGIHFKHVSLSADLVALSTKEQHSADPREELPTLTNEVLKAFASRSSKKTHSVRKHILHDVSGSFRPGTTTLVIGQPESGKSALMKLLSGRFPLDKTITLEGDMLYNGVPREQLLKRLPQFAGYVAQTDTNLPTLTVRETFEFAHECCSSKLSNCTETNASQGSPEANAKASEATHQHSPDDTLQSLGLTDCQNTIVGNEMIRGISGGERRRATTGEMEFGLKYVSFLDEISTGLDSAAAYDIIAAQRSAAKNRHRTVVISLLQPSPEILSLFDDVLLMNDGRVLYHGPIASVQSYFESLGLICPPWKDIADFLCEVATPQQKQYETSQSVTVKPPQTAQEFADLWLQSSIFQQLEAEAEAQDVRDQANSDTVSKFMDSVPEFQQSFGANLWTLMKREFILTRRNGAFVKGRLSLVAIVGLVFGSLFYQMDLTDAQVTMGVIFASSLFLGLGQEANLVVFYDARAVVYKQRAANFYRTAAYVLSCSLSQIPLALVESLIFGPLVYWLGGFVNEGGAFVLFQLFLLLMILVFGAVFFLLAVASPNLNIAKPIGMVCVLVVVLFSGFIVTKDSIPNWLIWLYWLDPVAWTVRGIAVSQYRSSQLDVCVYGGVDYCSTYGQTMGEYSLSLFGVPSDNAWVAFGVIFLVGSYVFLMTISYFVLEYHRYERPENVALPREPKDETVSDGDYNLLASPSSKNSGRNGEEADIVLAVSTRHKVQVQPVTVAFRDLWYTVSVPSGRGQPAQSVDLLKGITGYALPGSLTALMGSTGAGKTTLMDVIAGRKTAGTIKGEILLNGFPATDLSVRRCTGYCEQNDIHSTASTFREALIFSAFLRQGSDTPDSVKFDTVAECLELLDMEDIADHIIRGSSIEKMKRLTIGVEMAAQPSVLFLDEPTSGLDARSAKVIMDGVRRVADSGRTVLCTIHQPSSDVFFLFDSLLLLKRGGETVYFGDLGREGSSIIKYFEAIPSAPRIKEGYNPATWMLEVIGAGVDSHRKADSNINDDIVADEDIAVDFLEYFEASTSKALLDESLSKPGVFQPSTELEPLSFDGKRAASNALQLRLLLQRIFTTYWRTPSYTLMRLMISLLLALIIGFVYLGAEYNTYQGINSGLGMVYLSTMFISLISFMSGLPMIYDERAAFYRERAAQTYNSFWYFLSFTVVEIPYVFAGALVFVAVYYPMVGLQGFTEAVLYWVNLALLMLFQAYLAQLAVFSTPSLEVATVFGVLINSIGLMLTGFNPPALQIPTGYKWIYDIMPHRYTFSTLVAIIFGDCSETQLAEISLAAASPGGVGSLDLSGFPMGCQLVQNAPASVGEIPLKIYVQEVFGAKHDHILQYMAIFVGILLVFRVLTALAMRFVNHQQK